MASRMAERMGDLGDRARERMTEARLDKMDRENDRLKHEVRLLREDRTKSVALWHVRSMRWVGTSTSPWRPRRRSAAAGSSARS